jgi:hypothetical protein
MIMSGRDARGPEDHDASELIEDKDRRLDGKIIVIPV